jgi:hypothetical protein
MSGWRWQRVGGRLTRVPFPYCFIKPHCIPVLGRPQPLFFEELKETPKCMSCNSEFTNDDDLFDHLMEGHRQAEYRRIAKDLELFERFLRQKYRMH